MYDYELIVGENGKRLLAFGNFAGRAGMIDFLRGLGQRKRISNPNFNFDYLVMMNHFRV